MIGNVTDGSRAHSSWVPWGAPAQDTAGDGRIRVYCLPHAGGAATAYLPWARSAEQPGLEWLPVEIPGRGTRLREEPLSSMDELTARLVDALFTTPPAGPFVLLGHSMGAYVAHAVARRLARSGGPRPLCLVVSGARAPGAPAGEDLHLLPDRELIEALVELGGTPPEVLEHEELMDLMTPVIRADLTLLARHHEELVTGPVPAPLTCPVLALGGSADKLAGPQWISGWQATTTGPFRHRTFEGDHFFLHERRTEVTREIEAFLRSLADD